MASLAGIAPKGPTPATAAPYPFTPTADKNGEPTTCHCCGFRSDGLGLGSDALQKRGKDDPRYVCAQCAIVVGRLSRARRLDQFELRALDGGVDAVGEYISSVGLSDLSLYDELQRRLLVRAAWMGCADALRKELEAGNAPF